MSSERFEFGQEVRHPKCPEWGVGSVVKAEVVTVNGRNAQRLSVRFPGAGVKTLNTAYAKLEHVISEGPAESECVDESQVDVWDKISESQWLAPVAQKKIEEAMIVLPEQARDPFARLEQRLAFTLGLYRFDRTGRGLIDWAVAQTGMKDPLTRFNRHQLEQYFDRWAFERDAHLGRLLQGTGPDRAAIEDLLAKAPRAARDAVRKLSAVR